MDSDLNETSLAVLIDADNTPYSSVGLILDYCHKFGKTIIKRAYGDWSRPQLKEWGAIFREYAVKPMQQFQYTSGKNSTDIALVIDAMDILHSRSIGAVALVTSDSDFTGLALRIREEGIRVIGIGRKTSPQSFVKGCEEFHYIENLMPASPATNDHEESGKTEILSISGDEDGSDILKKAAQILADDNGNVLGSDLGLMLRKLDPSFSPLNYGSKNLSDFIKKHPDILVDTKKKSGMDKKYMVVSD